MDKRVWRIKWWRINENSLNIHTSRDHVVKRVNWMISVVISYDNCTIKCQDYMTIVALNQNSIISAMNLEIRQNSTKEAKMS